MRIRPKGMVISQSAIVCPKKKSPATLVSTYYLHTHTRTHTHTQPFSEGADNYNIARDDGGTSRQVHIHAELTIKHTSWEK